MDEIVKDQEKHPMVLLDGERTLAIDVATEMSHGYDLVMDIVDKLLGDTRIEDLKDDEGNLVGQRTHIHPQLLKWLREARLLRADIWKMTGGEIAQEVEKKKLEIKAKLIMQAIGSNPEEFESAKEKWMKSRSFKDDGK